jgi:predicted permease
MSSAEASLAARRQFGSPALVRQDVREMNSIVWIDHTVQDVRYALRQLLRQPVFAGIVIVTLALGIGSTTAIFSVVEAVLLRPLPYRDADRIVRIFEQSAERTHDTGYQQSLAAVWTRDVPVVRAQAPTLSHVGVFSELTATVTPEAGDSMRLGGVRVSPAVFDILGARPALGRAFLASEEAPSQELVVVISHSLWQRIFGGRSDVLGRSLTVDAEPFTVVGVMGEAFQFPDGQAQLWLPYTLGGRVSRTAPIARLADGVAIAAASSNVEAVMQQIRRTEPPSPGAPATGGVPRFELRSIQEHLVGPVRPLIVTLAWAVGLVLIIACANVANLLLNRNAARRQELALRVALGASHARVVRYVLTETLILASCGGLLGVLFAFGTISVLRTLGTTLARRDLTPGVSIPRLAEIQIDATALVFAVGMTLCVGLSVGLLPLIRHTLPRHLAMGMDGLARLANARTGPSRTGRAVLLVTQSALATMALVAGGLLVHSFLKLSSVDLGYEPARLLTFKVRSPANAGSVPFFDEVADRLRALPGVRAAGYAEMLPMVRYRTGGPLTPAQPMPPGTPAAPSPLDMRTVSHDFITAMGMPIVEGRTLRREDDGRAVVLNEALARSGFLGPRPLGQRVFVAGHPDPAEVVGIARDVRQYGLDQEPDPQVFVDARQLPLSNPSPYFAVRVDGDPAGLVASVRAAVRELDPEAAVDDVAMMQQIVSNALSRPRLFAALTGAFAIAGAFLAAIGVYGVTAYAVTHRTRELAVRLALGARPRAMLFLIVRHVVAWTLVGLSVGVAGSIALSRYLQGVLFGITPLDPTTFAAVCAGFLGIAVLAALIPARRIAAVDPLVALRTP